jgi:hypothetical protein
MAADSIFQLQKPNLLAISSRLSLRVRAIDFGLEGFAQALRHGLGIAKVRMGCCSALANETPSGACAAHSFGWAKQA